MGDEIVAVGAETGQAVPRAQFFVSANAGRSWTLGTLSAPGGGSPAPGHAAVFVAGGQGRWAAIGPDSIWTSGNGRAWTLVSATGLPRQAGDRVTVLKRTQGGFIAAGANVPDGDKAKATPVVFLSATGDHWRRLGASQLDLPAGRGRAADIRLVASDGNMILIAGDVTMPSGRGSGAWLSNNGGGSWRQVLVPANHGAKDQFTDAAATAGGFVLVRSATVNGVPAADVYRSGNGTAWTFAATLNTPAGFVPGLMNGRPGGAFSNAAGGPGQFSAVITGKSGRMLTAFVSRDGATWRQTPAFGNAAEAVSGVAVTTTGAVIAAGAPTTVPGGSERFITLSGPVGGIRSLSLTGIPGAVEPQLAVNAIAANGATQIVAGAANGFPAAWITVDGGRTWRRATGRTDAVLDRPGVQQLTGITHGRAGWLAVGGGNTGCTGYTDSTGNTGGGRAAGHPIVLVSTDGRVWSAADSEPAFAAGGVVTRGTAASRSGYVIVGYQQVSRSMIVSGHKATREVTIAAAWWAGGLTGWHRATVVAPNRPGPTAAAANRPGPTAAAPKAGGARMAAVTVAANGFVAVGSHGTYPAVWASREGRTWTRADLPLPPRTSNGVLEHVAAIGRIVVATGTARTAAGQVPFVARSADGGRTWTESLLPVPAGTAQVTAMAVTGGGFTVTGTFGTTPGQRDVLVWTSKEGRTWQAATPTGRGLTGPGIQAITGLTASGRTLVGVGFTASSRGEQLTYWRSLTR